MQNSTRNKIYPKTLITTHGETRERERNEGKTNGTKLRKIAIGKRKKLRGAKSYFINNSSPVTIYLRLTDRSAKNKKKQNTLNYVLLYALYNTASVVSIRDASLRMAAVLLFKYIRERERGKKKHE